jgi:hypothetical protein
MSTTLILVVIVIKLNVIIAAMRPQSYSCERPRVYMSKREYRWTWITIGILLSIAAFLMIWLHGGYVPSAHAEMTCETQGQTTYCWAGATGHQPRREG